MNDAEILAAVEKYGSHRATARALGVHHSKVARAVRRSAQPFEPGGIGAGPARDGLDPFIIKGVSTQFDRHGQQTGQWVKTRVDDVKRLDAIRAAYDAMAAELPRVAPIVPPKVADTKLLNLYTLSDAHVGLLSWGRETGADWDLNIAERTLFGCFEQMIERSPPAATAVINQLGDFLHYDGLSAITPTSGHILDADGRFQKMVEVAVRLLRRVVDLALAKHQQVHVLMCEGNHDLASSVWLRVMFKALYENEPRVTVDDSALPYYAYQHGEIMLAFHHGHMKKPEGLPLLFAAQFRKMWGATTKAYGHSGHQHHEAIKQFSGIKWTQHPTLAARDAYAARGGWMSEQAATCYTYHSEYGQWGSATVCPEMLELERAA